MDSYLKLARQLNKCSSFVSDSFTSAQPAILKIALVGIIGFAAKCIYDDCAVLEERIKEDDRRELEKRKFYREQQQKRKPVIEYVEK